jgi:hypothetical protein
MPNKWLHRDPRQTLLRRQQVGATTFNYLGGHAERFAAQ